MAGESSGETSVHGVIGSVLLALFLRDFFEFLRFFELAEELRRHEGVGELLLGVGDDALHKVVEVNTVLGVLLEFIRMHGPRMQCASHP